MMNDIPLELVDAYVCPDCDRVADEYHVMEGEPKRHLRDEIEEATAADIELIPLDHPTKYPAVEFEHRYVCPDCGQLMDHGGASGHDSRGQPQAVTWDICEDCGIIRDDLGSVGRTVSLSHKQL